MNSKWKEMILLVISVYQLILVICFRMTSKEMTADAVFLGILMLILGLGVDGIIWRTITRMEEKRFLEDRLGELYMQRQLELDYYEQKHEDIKKLTEVKQEFLWQLEQAEKLLDDKRYLEMRGAIEKANQIMIQAPLFRFCENSLVNAVLEMKAQKAQELGIQADFKARVEKEIAVEQIDLCSLFCNLIDNALEACVRIINDSTPKKIWVRADCRGSCLILHVQNTRRFPKDALGNTSKVIRFSGNEKYSITEKKEGDHGLGLKLVERVVKRYKGDLHIEYEKELVTVRAVLNYAELPVQSVRGR